MAMLDGVTRGELISALGWWVEAGIDVLVEDGAHDWLAGVAEAGAAPRPGSGAAVAAGHAPPARVPAAPAPPAARAITADSLPGLIAVIDAFRPGAMVDAGVAASGVLWMGDAPTAEDIAAGTIFSGEAGRLLDRMLASIGRDRTSAYLTNASYWPDGADAAPFRERQLQLARPRAVLALGGIATAALCGASAGINRMRGKWQIAHVGGDTVAVLPTFHPAYLLRHPQHKALAWADLCAFQARIDG